MRIVFMGTPEIAATCLRKIAGEGCEIVAVYTKPDTPKGRGHKMMMSPTKELALELGIPVEQPVTFKDEAVVETLRAYEPDLILFDENGGETEEYRRFYHR